MALTRINNNSLSAVTSAGIPGHGSLTGVDNWYITTNTSDVSDADITQNFSRNDNAGLIGTGMSESAGIFTFPETGYWLVTGAFIIQARTAALVHGAVDMKVSTDSGSTYSIVCRSECTADSTSEVQTPAMTGIIDVTDVSTVRLKFSLQVQTGSNMRVLGNSTNKRSNITFVRLGDT